MARYFVILWSMFNPETATARGLANPDSGLSPFWLQADTGLPDREFGWAIQEGLLYEVIERTDSGNYRPTLHGIKTFIAAIDQELISRRKTAQAPGLEVRP